jgi:nucleoside-diphosphate-sugar epimerase
VSGQSQDTLEGTSILVTGAAGFLGANLVRRLLELGCEVHALVRQSTELWRIDEIRARLTLHGADVLDLRALGTAFNRARPEFVFHLASVGGHPVERRRIREMLRTSVEGTYNVLVAGADIGVRQLVHVASALEYRPATRALKETDPLEPTTLRGVAKASATLLALMIGRSTGLRPAVLRPFSVYGPWEAPSHLIPTAVVAALRGYELALTPPGYRRDLVFVDDVVDACVLAAVSDAGAGEVINIGSGEEWSNEEVVELVRAVAGGDLPVDVGAYPLQPPDTAHWIADISKADRLLGWKPRYDLRAGLQETVAWLRQRLALYDR